MKDCVNAGDGPEADKQPVEQPSDAALVAQMEAVLQRLGAEAEAAARMAPQLIKRSRQRAQEKGISEGEALLELLKLVHDSREGTY